MDLYRQAARLLDQANAEQDPAKRDHLKQAAWQLYQAQREPKEGRGND